MLVLITNERGYMNQKTIKPNILNKNERQLQAYYEMNFYLQFPQIPEILIYIKNSSPTKEYYNRIEEGS